MIPYLLQAIPIMEGIGLLFVNKKELALLSSASIISVIVLFIL